MWEHLTAPQNVLFGLSLILLLVFFTMQVIGQLIGMRAFGWMDAALPDFGSDLDLDLDASALTDAASSGLLEQALSILNLGRIPLIISVIVFLFFFSFLGYNLQLMVLELGMPYLPAFVASGISFALALPILRFSNAGLSRVLPKDESEAVSSDTFIGRLATITIGTVTTTKQSEARLTGPLGRTHYIQVIADNEGAEFIQGDEVLVVGRKGPLFTVIAVRNPQLRDDGYQRSNT